MNAQEYLKNTLGLSDQEFKEISMSPKVCAMAMEAYALHKQASGEVIQTRFLDAGR